MPQPDTAEHRRLAESETRQADWKEWGPYVSARAWGTVREDYSPDGEAWGYFTHDQARSRAYRWNEDGLAGFCNRFQNVCLAVALWNERDPILKERLFGLTGAQGNHGEDVKEYYFYLDGTPTHSYMKMLYKYPQAEYPYEQLVAEAARRTRDDPEPELIDLLPDVFHTGRYFDIFIEYAKAGQEDLLCRITAVNRGPEAAPIHVLPHVWFRNTWSWGYKRPRPVIERAGRGAVRLQDRHLGERWWYAEDSAGSEPVPLFTENDTNRARLLGEPNETPYVKDAFHEAVCRGRTDLANPAQRGTKAAAHFRATVAPGESYTVRVRFTPVSYLAPGEYTGGQTDADDPPGESATSEATAVSPPVYSPGAKYGRPFADFDAVFDQRIREADEFYAAIQAPHLTPDQRLVQRQAWAGLLWCKQFYHYGAELWLDGDPAGPPSPPERRSGRNAGWRHLYALDVLTMPDNWEYPWFASWDLAFQCVPMAMIDPEWAKRQLILLLREWYMHPSGQLPAYEWRFDDVTPPVHAWAAWRVYKISRNLTGRADTDFLERVFHKLLLNFTWWVNREDRLGNNIFEEGFLGLDNVGVFDRNQPLPRGGFLEQADGTAWMGMFCLNMMAMALELARTRPAYEDVATKFFEHFIYIAHSITHMGGGELSLWDPEDGFFYDTLHMPGGMHQRLKLRSFVGLTPVLAVETIEPDLLDRLPRFRRRMEWFLQFRPRLVEHIAPLVECGECKRLLLSVVNREMLQRICSRMLDPAEFLSDHGLRSLSRYHAEHPYTFRLDDHTATVGYEPAESRSALFGGNSNWRGPVWFPLNFLMIESLQKYHHFYGDTFQVEMPRGSGRQMTLGQVATDLSCRLMRLFCRDAQGRRPLFGGSDYFNGDPHWRDHVPFYEYFHGDTGAGLGASHQTGWTALVAKLIQQSGG